MDLVLPPLQDEGSSDDQVYYIKQTGEIFPEYECVSVVGWWMDFISYYH